MRHDNYGHHHWKADDMAAFLLDTTGIKIEKVCHRTSGEPNRCLGNYQMSTTNDSLVTCPGRRVLVAPA